MSSPARFALLTAFLLAACSGANEARHESSAEVDVIRTARAAQNAAIEAGNVDSAAGFWTEDVEIRRGLGQLIVGRDGYRRLIAPTGNRDSALVYRRDPTSVVVSTTWPLAFEAGKWSGHLGAATGPTVINGDYSAQWVKRGGRWLIRGELFVAIGCDGIGCAYSAAP